MRSTESRSGGIRRRGSSAANGGVASGSVRRTTAAAVIALALGSASCTVGPDYHRPPVSAPATFRGIEPGVPPGPQTLVDLAWWEYYQDPVLQSLIGTAIAENYDLRVAVARIIDARAQVTIARSFQFPELSGSSSAIYSRVEGGLGTLQFRDTFQPVGSLDLSYEVDFWGRYRRGTEAARADLLSTEESRRFIITALVSDVAAAYVQLRSLDLELAVARDTLASRRESLRLVTMREEGGVAALIDVRQAEILVAGALQVIPDTERQIEQTENAIAILLGHSPEPIPRSLPLGQLPSFPSVPPGVPSELLERRPDVRQAEALLAAATARIGVAKSDYFPRVFLTGSAGVGGLMINGSWFGPQGLFAIGPSLTVPIFNSGRVGAGVTSAEARAQAALDQYQQTILQAFRDVSDSLVEAKKRREFRIDQEALLVAAEDTTRLANIRYLGGVSSYLEVLDSDRQRFEAALNLVRAVRDERLAAVRLYKSVGGGWQDVPGPAVR